MRRALLLATILIPLVALTLLEGQEISYPFTKVPDRATLEKDFAEKLTGATLVGRFTTVDRAGDKPPREEKYTLTEVSKVRDELWLFKARIQYGNNDATLPLTLEVKWAGDTPVLTMTDFPVPGFGKFTCRILFYGDQYAGTWDGGDHGGHMFGRIVKGEKK